LEELEAKKAELERSNGICQDVKEEAEGVEFKNEPPPAPTRIVLRGRKPKAIEPIREENVNDSRNRRKTVAAAPVISVSSSVYCHPVKC
jgi:hypothetical protein